MNRLKMELCALMQVPNNRSYTDVIDRHVNIKLNQSIARRFRSTEIRCVIVLLQAMHTEHIDGIERLLRIPVDEELCR